MFHSYVNGTSPAVYFRRFKCKPGEFESNPLLRSGLMPTHGHFDAVQAVMPTDFRPRPIRKVSDEPGREALGLNGLTSLKLRRNN